jgi:hypothetical protein
MTWGIVSHTRQWWCSRRESPLRIRAHTPVGAGLVVRGGDLSGVPLVGELVGDAANWPKTGRLASVGLDQGPFSSLSRIFALTLSILAFILSMVLDCLMF